jgi:hypothetical protein
MVHEPVAAIPSDHIVALLRSQNQSLGPPLSATSHMTKNCQHDQKLRTQTGKVRGEHFEEPYRREVPQHQQGERSVPAPDRHETRFESAQICFQKTKQASLDRVCGLECEPTSISRVQER